MLCAPQKQISKTHMGMPAKLVVQHLRSRSGVAVAGKGRALAGAVVRSRLPRAVVLPRGRMVRGAVAVHAGRQRALRVRLVRGRVVVPRAGGVRGRPGRALGRRRLSRLHRAGEFQTSQKRVCLADQGHGVKDRPQQDRDHSLPLAACEVTPEITLTEPTMFRVWSDNIGRMLPKAVERQHLQLPMTWLCPHLRMRLFGAHRRPRARGRRAVVAHRPDRDVALCMPDR